MNTRWIGVFALITLIVTIFWLVLLIVTLSRTGPLETLPQALNFAIGADVIFYLTYINATLVTLSATFFFGGLYAYSRSISPLWSAMALVFIPVYSLLNLFSYLSQITIVPRLVAFLDVAGLGNAANLMLGLMIQQWPGSAVNTFNNLGYAILGIPSIIFGLILFAQIGRFMLRLGGLMLVLQGAAAIIGFIGILAGNELVGLGSLVAGGLFLIALIPLSWHWLQAPSS